MAQFVMTLWLVSHRGGEFAIAQWARGVEEPLDDVGEFSDRSPACIVEVAFGVVDSARQDVQIVMQMIEFCAGDDEFVVAEFQFTRSLACHPIPLATSLTAERPRPARP
jgi:hypothetical protein